MVRNGNHEWQIDAGIETRKRGKNFFIQKTWELFSFNKLGTYNSKSWELS
jgi:hypothetical protein